VGLVVAVDGAAPVSGVALFHGAGGIGGQSRFGNLGRKSSGR